MTSEDGVKRKNRDKICMHSMHTYGRP